MRASQLAIALVEFLPLVLGLPANVERSSGGALRTTAIKKRFPGTKRSFTSVLANDRAFINTVSAKVHNKAEKRGLKASITNRDIDYVVNVNVGGEDSLLLVDTGSSVLWFGHNHTFTGTAAATGNQFGVGYGGGVVEGYAYIGTVTIGDATATNQLFGVADLSETEGFTDFGEVDGILGLGPVGLTEGTYENEDLVPTFMDNLYSEGTIASEILGVYLKQEDGSDTDDTNGELAFGFADTDKYVAPLTYHATSSVDPYSAYWSVDVSALSYDGTTLTTTTSYPSLVDTGTALFYIPIDPFNAWLTASGGSVDPNTGFVIWTTKPTENFVVTIDSATYTLTPDQYLVPEAQYAFSDFPEGYYYAWINTTGDVFGVLGQKFLESFYSAYNTGTSSIGFAARA